MQSSNEISPDDLAKLLSSQPAIHSAVADAGSEQPSAAATPHSPTALTLDSLDRASVAESTRLHDELSLASDGSTRVSSPSVSAEPLLQATTCVQLQSTSGLLTVTDKQTAGDPLCSTQQTTDSASELVEQEPQHLPSSTESTWSRTPTLATLSSRARPFAALDSAGAGLLALVADASASAGAELEPGGAGVCSAALADGLAWIVAGRLPPSSSHKPADKDARRAHHASAPGTNKVNAADSALAPASHPLSSIAASAGDHSVRATLPCEWVTPLGVLFGQLVLTREYLCFTGDPQATREKLDQPDSPSSIALLALLPGLHTPRNYLIFYLRVYTSCVIIPSLLSLIIICAIILLCIIK